MEGSIPDHNNVLVAVRLRPSDSPSCVRVSSGDVISVNPDTNDKKTFSYDIAFPPSSNQAEVYNELGHHILDSSLMGYNTCLFAYGQTGSGKTYTMIGDEHKTDVGVIPRLCAELFDRLESSKQKHVEDAISTGVYSYSVSIEFLELYGENVRDLLDPEVAGKSHVDLKIREHPTKGPYVEGLNRKTVTSAKELIKQLETGSKLRHTASTKLNSVSSRSHAVLIVRLSQTVTASSVSANAALPEPSCDDGDIPAPTSELDDQVVISSKQSVINLIDLAGSERVKDSGAEGQHLKEASNINSSLSALGIVISTLSSMTSEKTFVPYRNSKLTWLLKESLGGNSRTIMIATVRSSSQYYNETMSTLRYASQCKKIVNKAVINEDPTAKKIHELMYIVQMLREKIKALQDQGDGAFEDAAEELGVLLQELSVDRQLMSNLNNIYKKQLSGDDVAIELQKANSQLQYLQSQGYKPQSEEVKALQKKIRALEEMQGTNEKETEDLKLVIEKLNDERVVLAGKNAAIKAIQEEIDHHKVQAAVALDAANAELQQVRAREGQLKHKLVEEQTTLSALIRSQETELSQIRSQIEDYKLKLSQSKARCNHYRSRRGQPQPGPSPLRWSAEERNRLQQTLACLNTDLRQTYDETIKCEQTTQELRRRLANGGAEDGTVPSDSLRTPRKYPPLDPSMSTRSHVSSSAASRSSGQSYPPGSFPQPSARTADDSLAQELGSQGGWTDRQLDLTSRSSNVAPFSASGSTAESSRGYLPEAVPAVVSTSFAAASSNAVPRPNIPNAYSGSAIAVPLATVGNRPLSVPPLTLQSPAMVPLSNRSRDVTSPSSTIGHATSVRTSNAPSTRSSFLSSFRKLTSVFTRSKSVPPPSSSRTNEALPSTSPLTQFSHTNPATPMMTPAPLGSPLVCPVPTTAAVSSSFSNAHFVHRAPSSSPQPQTQQQQRPLSSEFRRPAWDPKRSAKMEKQMKKLQQKLQKQREREEERLVKLGRGVGGSGGGRGSSSGGRTFF